MFGLGSSAYPNYCSFSKRIDELLSKIGVRQLLELHTGDEQENQELAFKDWSTKIYEVRTNVTSDWVIIITLAGKVVNVTEK